MIVSSGIFMAIETRAAALASGVISLRAWLQIPRNACNPFCCESPFLYDHTRPRAAGDQPGSRVTHVGTVNHLRWYRRSFGGGVSEFTIRKGIDGMKYKLSLAFSGDILYNECVTVVKLVFGPGLYCFAKIWYHFNITISTEKPAATVTRSPGNGRDRLFLRTLGAEINKRPQMAKTPAAQKF